MQSVNVWIAYWNNYRKKNMKLKILKVHWKEKQFNVFIEMYEFIR